VQQTEARRDSIGGRDDVMTAGSELGGSPSHGHIRKPVRGPGNATCMHKGDVEWTRGRHIQSLHSPRTHAASGWPIWREVSVVARWCGLRRLGDTAAAGGPNPPSACT
jgi:hypothetical protein